MTEQLFIYKYQPLYFKDFGENKEVINIIEMLISMNSINLLLIGTISSGKTSLLNIC